MRGLGLCQVLLDLGEEKPWSNEWPVISQEHRPTPARRIAFRQGEILDGIPVACEGWAARMVQITNGRRQILSFLLPGEIVTAALVFDPQLRFSIEAVTRGCYRCFDRSQLRHAMFVSPAIFERVMTASNDERKRAEQLITDLGRRTASERVARLILDLWDRLGKAGLVDGDSVDFPLRQTHIAEATGLTPVYVNKVLGEFRKNGLMTITERSLQMTDETRLRRLAA
ncbi:MAG TPA: Crp/Fnr family transcriptional regulator [Pseudolabrys sp.]|nr:Crp/Fnr family transcriptional regulator [Pseudolabrys sp.]